MNKILLLVGLLFSVVANAAPSETGEIEFLQIHKVPESTGNSDNRYIVKLANSEISDNNCGYDQWTGYFDTEAGKAQYAAVLSAAISDKKILIEGTSSTTCQGGNQIIRNVYVAW